MGFNTEDGSGRAAMPSGFSSSIVAHVSIPRTVAGGLQYSFGRLSPNTNKSFNTEDGSGRAAIIVFGALFIVVSIVSIPRTVAGGLQY